MKIHKEINIPLEKYRADLSNPKRGYSENDVKKLSCLYDMFENGSLNAAIEFCRDWPREDKEMIPCDIFDILFDISMGREYKFEL